MSRFLLIDKKQIDFNDGSSVLPTSYLDLDRKIVAYCPGESPTGTLRATVPGVVVSDEYPTTWRRPAVDIELITDVKLKSKTTMALESMGFSRICFWYPTQESVC